MVRKSIHIVLLLLINLAGTGQTFTNDGQSHIESILESVTDNLDPDADGALILEDLQGYLLDKLNINSATHDQLSKLHLLDEVQISKLIAYREQYGQILSIYELNTIDGFHPDLLIQIEPFIVFGPVEDNPQTVGQILSYGHHELLLRTQYLMQEQSGYKQRADGSIPYEGGRYRHYARYRFQSADYLSAGITAEKDPGESFFTASNPQGFDFHSAHLSIRPGKVVQNVTAGDFVVRSGQGLVLWQGFSPGRPVQAINFSKTGQGVRPYTSSGENNFFRGGAATFKLGNTDLSLFVSGKKSDANIVSTDSAGLYFTSLQSSGYHRTNAEIADKNSVSDFNAGGMFSYRQGSFKVGAVFVYRRFGLPFMPADQLYNRFNFRGEENFTTGFDYLYSKGKYQLFGEAAVSKSGGKAAVQGITIYLHDRLQFSALARHFGKNYHALWAAPFGSGSSSNETGFYTGVRTLPLKYVVLSAWTEYYRSDWIKYTTAGPSDGWKMFVQADVHPSSRLSINLRYRHDEKSVKFRNDAKNENFPEEIKKCRLHLQYQLTSHILLKSRLEHVLYSGQENTYGILAYQDVQLTPETIPINLTIRMAWFNTDDYNARIYTWENDLLYAYSIPAYFGNGIRSYLNLKYKVSRNIEVWFKLGNSLYSNAESIGTGYSQIDGNQKTELKFQLRLKL